MTDEVCKRLADAALMRLAEGPGGLTSEQLLRLVPPEQVLPTARQAARVMLGCTAGMGGRLLTAVQANAAQVVAELQGGHCADPTQQLAAAALALLGPAVVQLQRDALQALLSLLACACTTPLLSHIKHLLDSGEYDLLTSGCHADELGVAVAFSWGTVQAPDAWACVLRHRDWHFRSTNTTSISVALLAGSLVSHLPRTAGTAAAALANQLTAGERVIDAMAQLQDELQLSAHGQEGSTGVPLSAGSRPHTRSSDPEHVLRSTAPCVERLSKLLSAPPHGLFAETITALLADFSAQLIMVLLKHARTVERLEAVQLSLSQAACALLRYPHTAAFITEAHRKGLLLFFCEEAAAQQIAAGDAKTVDLQGFLSIPPHHVLPTLLRLATEQRTWAFREPPNRVLPSFLARALPAIFVQHALEDTGWVLQATLEQQVELAIELAVQHACNIPSGVRLGSREKDLATFLQLHRAVPDVADAFPSSIIEDSTIPLLLAMLRRLGQGALAFRMPGFPSELRKQLWKRAFGCGPGGGGQAAGGGGLRQGGSKQPGCGGAGSAAGVCTCCIPNAVPEGLGGLPLLQLASAELPSGARMQVWAGLPGGGGSQATGGSSSSSSSSSSAARPEGGGGGAGAPRTGPGNTGVRESGAPQPAAKPGTGSAAARPAGGGPIQEALAPTSTASASEPAARTAQELLQGNNPLPAAPDGRQGAGMAARLRRLLESRRGAGPVGEADSPAGSGATTAAAGLEGAAGPAAGPAAGRGSAAAPGREPCLSEAAKAEEAAAAVAAALLAEEEAEQAAAAAAASSRRQPSRKQQRRQQHAQQAAAPPAQPRATAAGQDAEPQQGTAQQGAAEEGAGPAPLLSLHHPTAFDALREGSAAAPSPHAPAVPAAAPAGKHAGPGKQHAPARPEQQAAAAKGKAGAAGQQASSGPVLAGPVKPGPPPSTQQGSGEQRVRRRGQRGGQKRRSKGEEGAPAGAQERHTVPAGSSSGGGTSASQPAAGCDAALPAPAPPPLSPTKPTKPAPSAAVGGGIAAVWQRAGSGAGTAVQQQQQQEDEHENGGEELGELLDMLLAPPPPPGPPDVQPSQPELAPAGAAARSGGSEQHELDAMLGLLLGQGQPAAELPWGAAAQQAAAAPPAVSGAAGRAGTGAPQPGQLDPLCQLSSTQGQQPMGSVAPAPGPGSSPAGCSVPSRAAAGSKRAAQQRYSPLSHRPHQLQARGAGPLSAPAHGAAPASTAPAGVSYSTPSPSSQAGPSAAEGQGLDDDEELCCPITMDIMLDPVVAADGFTYERAAIEAWLQDHDTSPVTNLALQHKGLQANHLARRLISRQLGER